MDEPRSEVQSFYKDKIIFITGASGFMGKVLMEKLLYSCSDLNKIYILLRDKKNRSCKDRLQDIFDTPLFQRLRHEKPEILKKVIAVNGDISIDNLSLTTEDCERLINEVNVVFHGAADLRMNAKLKESVEKNLIGTHRVLELTKQMKHLQAFVHMSTAFCHIDQDEIGERIYNSVYDPSELMRFVQWLDEETIDLITPKLLGPHPNCYTYTKYLTESLVASEYPNLPCCIARPSIVFPAYSEPLPGWVDNLNGPTGIIAGIAKGVIRSVCCKGDCKVELIPVDIAINCLIVIAYDVATSEKKVNSMPVFNLTQGNIRPVTWRELYMTLWNIGQKNPFERQIWYPATTFLHSSKFVHNILVFLYGIIPAYLIDFLMLISGQKRFMVGLQKRILTGLEVLRYFISRNWKVCNNKTIALGNKLSPADQKIFPILHHDFDECLYMKNIILGTRQYGMRESLSTLPQTRRRQKVLYVLHITTVCLFYVGILYFIYSKFEVVRFCVDCVSEKIQSLLHL